MAKGILYVMETNFNRAVVFDCVGVQDYRGEMERLEKAKLAGIGDLKETYAVLVDGYEQKGALLKKIFEHRKIAQDNLFIMDSDMLIQLLKSFNGDQIYPSLPPEEDLVSALRSYVPAERTIKENWGKVPSGMYYLSESRKLLGHIKAQMQVVGGLFVVKAGSQCFPTIGLAPRVREKAVIVDGVLQDDVVCHSPTAAATVVMGRKINGWKAWKNINDTPINIYRSDEYHQTDGES